MGSLDFAIRGAGLSNIRPVTISASTLASASAARAPVNSGPSRRGWTLERTHSPAANPRRILARISAAIKPKATAQHLAVTVGVGVPYQKCPYGTGGGYGRPRHCISYRLCVEIDCAGFGRHDAKDSGYQRGSNCDDFGLLLFSIRVALSFDDIRHTHSDIVSDLKRPGYPGSIEGGTCKNISIDMKIVVRRCLFTDSYSDV